MISLYDAVVEVVGTPPVGMEPLVYVICCVILLFLLSTAFRLIGEVLNWIGGK